MGRRDRRSFLTALAGAAVAVPNLVACAARSRARPVRLWPAVQRLIDGYVADRKFPGAAVALSYDGSPLTYLNAGNIAFDSADRFDEHSICRIHSMTKPVTGIAAMCLVEDGRIRLDQPVADVVPELASPRVAIDLQKGLESRPAVKTMTMRHLLTHTSGFSYWTPLSGDDALPSAYRQRGITPGNYGSWGLSRPGYGPQAKGLVDMVERLAALPLASEPGTAWQYSVGLDVMGLVIERVTGKRFDVFLRERLFEPLQMDSTGFQVRPADVGRLTTNYQITREGPQVRDPAATSVWLQPSSLLAGGGGLVSTARDFTRFGLMLLGDGKLENARVLKPGTVRLARADLLPPGVASSRGGNAAGAAVVLPGVRSHLGPPGTLSHGGAAGTLWLVDFERRGNFVFMSQHMPPGTYPIWEETTAAIAADLAQAAPRQ